MEQENASQVVFVYSLVIPDDATCYGYKGLLPLSDWMNEIDEQRERYNQRNDEDIVVVVETKNNKLCKNQVKMEQEEAKEEGAKWIKHYCSDHHILLVGEGDFSFSLSLAKSFGSAANIVATSRDSYDDVTKMYKHAKSNLNDLQELGACLLHGVDATKMKLHSDLKMRRFDRVIFNFPHAGFRGKEDNKLLIKMHKDLVLGFFRNASCILRANGEIHVSHKTTAPFNKWNIEKLATQSLLTLIECADFKKEDYPYYNNKRGDSYRCDEPFPLGKCCTFKFIYNPKATQNHKKRNGMVVSRQQTNLLLQEIKDAVEYLPSSVPLSYHPQTSSIPKMNEAVSSIFGLTNRHTSITSDHLSNMAEVYGRGPQRSLHPREPLQSLKPCTSSTNVGYSQAVHVRTMDVVPLSLGARNEGYNVFGGSSNYFKEESLGRTTQMTNRHTSITSGHLSNMAEVYGRGPQRSLHPREPLQSSKPCTSSTNVGYSQAVHVRTMDVVPLSLGARNEGYNVFGGSSNYFKEESFGRTTQMTNRHTSITSGHLSNMTEVYGRGPQRSLHPREPLHSLKPCTSSTNVGCSQAVHVRTMDVVPLSLGARNEGYNVFGGSSNYFKEASLGRTTQMTSYCFDRESPDFKRYIAEVPGRAVQSELHQMNVLMPERRRVFVES
ncbi:hypothetical protein VNO77_43197 [Canavalia gladiata]|uniref:25S rRNA (uridine-N(3))-methyltransferase BMT5-like domain-containing protein n=1 Tax=Canavalia gladiata TaxID=3824 RepID=A0AAN9JVW6_CANGL